MGCIDETRRRLGEGRCLPACPLALDAGRRFDPRRQRALFRYYLDAGAGGLAIGVHTTQFAIRDPRHGLLRPVLELGRDVLSERRERGLSLVGVGGICGDTGQAVAEVIPLFGFYLQTAVGGRRLSLGFWRRFATMPNVVAIKIAPFNRYQTLDVIRAVTETGRDDVALYTGNDDSILLDLLTPYRLRVGEGEVERRMVGGLLGHWAVWTRAAAADHAECLRLARSGAPIPAEWLRRSVEVTDANAAFFDAANGYAGCIAGLHEVLRRQGLFAGTWCLDPTETLSPGQAEEIDRVQRAYPHLNDDAFVAEHLDEWMG
ncbi:hypothetical protein BAC2_00589 [uncultured bacterium]|nr:hypothetical protein BAC2_00589 [uncultured bacterium]